MKAEETRESQPQVTVRNTLRRPLTFRVGGETIRLSPGAALELDESLLLSSELQHFCSRGVVSVIRPTAEPEIDESGDDAPGDAEFDDEERPDAEAAADGGESAEQKRDDAPARRAPRPSKGVRNQRPTGNS
jgi:hypothetical protein